LEIVRRFRPRNDQADDSEGHKSTQFCGGFPMSGALSDESVGLPTRLLEVPTCSVLQRVRPYLRGIFRMNPLIEKPRRGGAKARLKYYPHLLNCGVETETRHRNQVNANCGKSERRRHGTPRRRGHTLSNCLHCFPEKGSGAPCPVPTSPPLMPASFQAP
jgi:hypothetical protein